jgi:glycerol-3-phosphate dehydrogenase
VQSQAQPDDLSADALRAAAPESRVELLEPPVSVSEIP